MKPHRLLVLLGFSVAGVASATAQSFTTVFGPGGTVGASVPDTSVLNGIDAFTTFGAANNDTDVFAGTANAGESLFFQIGPLYVGGAGPATSNPLSAQGETNLGGPVSNNRAYGVIGRGRSDIVFDAGIVDAVVLQVRGTSDGLTTGTSPSTNFGGTPTDLLDAAGTLLVWTNLGVEARLAIPNDDFVSFSLNAADFLGDSITRVSLINEADHSAVLLGELTTTLIPEPGVLGMLSLAGLSLLRRR